MPRRRVLLVQLPIPPLGPEPVTGNVPLAAAYLKLHALKHRLDAGFDIDILPAAEANRLGDHALIEAILARAPDLLGFTTYLWNVDRTLWIAERIKAARPATRVVIGGPEVTRDNTWLLESSAVDWAVFGEGEQTFVEFLRHLDSEDAAPVPVAGLLRRGESPAAVLPRVPMADLDAISSPYLHGILNAGDADQLLLETIRGCIFNCKFCFYPKAYDRLYYVSDDKIRANLEHARRYGAKEVFLLDPTLNQRKDFTALLELLRDANLEQTFELHAELRAEGLKVEHARLMKEANFKEVEIGLQSIDPQAQELMDRHNNLRAFETGVRALQAVGVGVKVDLIVGLPGDTVESIRTGMRWVAENRLYDTIQVFQLSILPGTAFRHEAEALGLRFQDRPPYYVLETPTLSLDDMQGLLAEAEDLFDMEFDPLPPPTIPGGAGADGIADHVRFDFDARRLPALPRAVTQAFTMVFAGRDPYGRLDRAVQAVRSHLTDNPFSTLEIVIETATDFPLDVFDVLREAAARPVNLYLDRFHEFTTARGAGALRFVTVFPLASRADVPDDWIEAALQACDIIWRDDNTALELQPADRPGEWFATAGSPKS